MAQCRKPIDARRLDARRAGRPRDPASLAAEAQRLQSAWSEVRLNTDLIRQGWNTSRYWSPTDIARRHGVSRSSVIKMLKKAEHFVELGREPPELWETIAWPSHDTSSAASPEAAVAHTTQ